MCVIDDDDAAREVELGTRFNPAPLDDDIAAPLVLDLDLFRLAICTTLLLTQFHIYLITVVYFEQTISLYKKFKSVTIYNFFLNLLYLGFLEVFLIRSCRASQNLTLCLTSWPLLVLA